jgi:hypothetical protein
LSKDTLDTVVKSLQAIFFLIMIVITVYSQVSPYLNDFWKGFALGALVVFLPMLIFNIYLTRKSKGVHRKQPTEKETTNEIAPRQQIVVPPPKDDELLRVLREFTNRWEQYKQLDQMQRWAIQGDLQKFAKQASSRLLVLVSKYAESWDFSLRNPVRIISDDLQKLALMPVSIIGPGEWLTDIEKQGDEAYQRTQAILSFLATKGTTR